METRRVAGFLPSTSGFAFANSFPRLPLRRIGVPGVLSLGIGDASNGLCGGMAFAARDYFEAGREPPETEVAPGSGPLFDYLVDRLFESFDLPAGPVRYLRLMSPLLSDGETFWSRIGVAPHGRAWRMVREEWPRVRGDIDAGHPSPLGLVRVRSSDPFDLKENHQVLAYGYALDGDELTLSLYDPNRPKRDDVTLSMNVADPTRPISLSMPTSGRSVIAFFRVKYAPAAPPAG